MTQLGNDPAQLRALARTLEQERAALEGAFQAVTARLSATWWQGQDATRFAEHWQQHHHASLRRAISSLSDAEAALYHNARLQERASGS